MIRLNSLEKVLKRTICEDFFFEKRGVWWGKDMLLNKILPGLFRLRGCQYDENGQFMAEVTLNIQW